MLKSHCNNNNEKKKKKKMQVLGSETHIRRIDKLPTDKIFTYIASRK